ncbi:hypothetical protein Pla86_23810 [Planctomycetes bacterium Pla86]|uniref:Uncharacterized protein n=2 Tax=Engelhardtia mirabilis TaxID=2528011 RepID=A0A518BK01_9BACT|nr:hypothetical protein Pla133_23820 [Planctomycetes bacterium Pla133]QDV01628.1 hypothetical protein Pla86_23810 [Planctomycetes bacterium Pla86]
MRQYLAKVYPGVDLDGVAKPAFLDGPMETQLPWDEVKPRAEACMLEHFALASGATHENLAKKAISGASSQSLRDRLTVVFLQRDPALTSDEIEALLKRARSTMGHVADAQRQIELAKYRALDRKLASGRYDVFEYVTIPELRVHSAATNNTIANSFYAGDGWVAQACLDREEVVDLESLQSACAAEVDLWIEGLIP